MPEIPMVKDMFCPVCGTFKKVEKDKKGKIKRICPRNCEENNISENYKNKESTGTKYNNVKQIKIDEEKLYNLLDKIEKGLVFATKTELESLVESASENQAKLIKSCIKGIAAGIYVKFICAGSAEVGRGRVCYVKGDYTNIKPTLFLKLDDVICEKKPDCRYIQQSQKELCCVFYGNGGEINKAQDLIKMLN